MRPSSISIIAITHYPKLMQPPSHNDPQPNYEYLLVIRHSSQVKVMLARDGDGGHWKLPSFVPEVTAFSAVRPSVSSNFQPATGAPLSITGEENF